ncbi:hypothetical protein BHE74_00007058 [Ensete ventricosum]|nr:hypothetical protein BHE74_00007058 [Ensete ventricosum]
MDRLVNLPRGYGYVEFKKRVDAEKALLYMDGFLHGGDLCHRHRGDPLLQIEELVHRDAGLIPLLVVVWNLPYVAE